MTIEYRNGSEIMAKEKTILRVVGNSNQCNACKSEKAFLEKNKRAIKKAGINEVEFINPGANKDHEAIATLYQNKYIGGKKAQPLTVIVRGGDDTAFLGFSKKGFMGKVKNSVKVLNNIEVPNADKPKKKVGLFGKK